MLLSALLLAPTASPAADREFKQIVRRLADHYEKRPMGGMGFLGFLANCFSPAGVSHLKMAIFEDVDAIRKPLGQDFEGFLRASVGDDYHPFVTVRSNRSGERVFIFAKEVGERMELLMVCAESHETVVLKVRIAPDALEAWLKDPSSMARVSARGGCSH